MVRSQLITLLIENNPGLPRHIARRVVNCFFTTITIQLLIGGRIELRGFGVFFSSARDARKGRNPRSGSPVQVEAKRTTRFRAGREMTRRLNPRTGEAPRPPLRSNRYRRRGSGEGAASSPI